MHDSVERCYECSNFLSPDGRAGDLSEIEVAEETRPQILDVTPAERRGGNRGLVERPATIRETAGAAVIRDLFHEAQELFRLPRVARSNPVVGRRKIPDKCQKRADMANGENASEFQLKYHG